jgi:murein DD-endopeptidase MepM/ murein hydrolase activator NlpD
VQTEDSTTAQRRLRTLLTRKQQHWIIAGGVAIVLAGAATALRHPDSRQAAALLFAKPAQQSLQVIPQELKWGFATDRFLVSTQTLRSGDVLGKILLPHGMSNQDIHQLVQRAGAAGFQISNMRIGKDLVFLTPTGAAHPSYMVYEPSPYEYVTFQLSAPFEVVVHKRDVITQIVTNSGVLETSFWEALTDNGLNDELADGMIDILATSVDFYHQKQGDRFKIVYEQHIVEGKPVGTGKILAAEYERDGKSAFAFNFDLAGQSCKYFDFDGRPARQAFLKAPLKVSRITSRYNLNRLHPVLGFHKAHFGTDYAAPHGTPIMAVADGTVTEATRRGGNGNYVRIRHNGTYETQYLHMSGFAKGIRPGTHVAQGQTIGYVGSTGLATGPHVCFRFWKNGQQVDHLRLNLPSPEPIKGQDFEQYKVVRDELKKKLDAVPYRTKAAP